jgi:hypothetical protein
LRCFIFIFKTGVLKIKIKIKNASPIMFIIFEFVYVESKVIYVTATTSENLCEFLRASKYCAKEIVKLHPVVRFGLIDTLCVVMSPSGGSMGSARSVHSKTSFDSSSSISSDSSGSSSSSSTSSSSSSEDEVANKSGIPESVGMPEDVAARGAPLYSSVPIVPDSVVPVSARVDVSDSSVPVSARVDEDISAVSAIMELGTVMLGSAGLNIVDQGTAIASDSFVSEKVATLVTDPQGAPVRPEVEGAVETPESPMMGNDSDGGGEASSDSQSVSQDHR